MDFLDSYDHSLGYNIACRADRSKMSDEHREKIRQATIRHHGISKEKEEKILELYNDPEYYIKRIADELGMRSSCIIRILKRNKVQLDHKKRYGSSFFRSKTNGN